MLQMKKTHCVLSGDLYHQNGVLDLYRDDYHYRRRRRTGHDVSIIDDTHLFVSLLNIAYFLLSNRITDIYGIFYLACRAMACGDDDGGGELACLFPPSSHFSNT